MDLGRQLHEGRVLDISYIGKPANAEFSVSLQVVTWDDEQTKYNVTYTPS
jgi:hypothetical protein